MNNTTLYIVADHENEFDYLVNENNGKPYSCGSLGDYYSSWDEILSRYPEADLFHVECAETGRISEFSRIDVEKWV